MVPLHRGRSEAGFTLLELLVASTITLIVTGLFFLAFDLNSNVTRVQSDLTKVQQSLRVSHRELAKYVRMAGRGGIPRAMAFPFDPANPAATAEDNVVAGTMIGVLEAAEGTDVLTIRGAFSTPVFRADTSNPTTFQITGNTATLVIDSLTKARYLQPVEHLLALIDPDDGSIPPEAVILVSGQGDAIYGVVELAGIAVQEIEVDIQNVATLIQRVTLSLNINAAAGVHTADYLALSAGGVYPNNLTTVLFCAILEEYRFFVYDADAGLGYEDYWQGMELVRAKMLPGTNVVHPGDPANAALVLASGITDLQVSLGIDLDGDGFVDTEDGNGDPLDLDADEWFRNDANDDATLGWVAQQLKSVRVSLVGRTKSPDLRYLAPAIVAIENHEYGESTTPTGDEFLQRRYRRRRLQGTIDLRNL